MKYGKVKMVILGCCIAAFNIAVASPQATQEWVRKYVSTNMIDLTTINPQTITVSDGTNTAVVTLNWMICKNPAIEVYGSNVDGMPNGIRFASVGLNQYVNVTNPSCDVVVGTYENWGKVVILGTTNDNQVVVYRCKVGGVNYFSEKLYGEEKYCFYQEGWTNSLAGSRFYIKKIAIGDYEKRVLTTAPASFSFFDLFIQNAFALIKCDFEKDPSITKNPEKIEETDEYTVWRTHWTYDLKLEESDAITLKLDSLKVKSGGRDVEISLGEHGDILELTAGMYIKDANLAIVLGLEKLKNIDKIVGDVIKEEFGPIISRLVLNSDSYKNKKYEIQEYLIALGEEYLSYEFPLKDYTDEVTQKSEPEPEPEPPKPNYPIIPPASHVHIEFYGSCGNWKCGTCDEKVMHGYVRNALTGKMVDTNFPSEHNYQWRPGKHCQRCINTTPVKCADADKAPLKVECHSGWRDSYRIVGDDTEKSHVCVCHNNFMVQDHHYSPSNGWRHVSSTVIGSPDICQQAYACYNISTKPGDMSCGYVDWRDATHNMIYTNYWKDSDSTIIDSECLHKRICTHAYDQNGAPMCGYSDFVAEATGHIWTNIYSVPYTDGTIKYTHHELHATCHHCDKIIVGADNHNYGQPTFTNIGGQVSHTHHYIVRKCDVDGTLNPHCGFAFVTNFPHGFTEITCSVNNVEFHQVSNRCDHVVTESAFDSACNVLIYKEDIPHNFVTNGWMWINAQYCAPRLVCKDCLEVIPDESRKELHNKTPDVGQYSTKASAVYHYCSRCNDARTHEKHTWEHVEEGSLGPHDYCNPANGGCGLNVLDDTIEDDESDADDDAAPTLQMNGPSSPDDLDDMVND